MSEVGTQSPNIVLSVVIPTYNRCAILARTLEQLGLQSVAIAWEVVVVNNRCTDDTNAVVAGLAAAFPGTLRVVQEEKPGASAARNCGIREARGELLVLLDDDICLEAGALDRAVADHVADPSSWFVARIVPLPEHLVTPFGAFRAAASSLSTQTVPVAEADLLPEVETFASGFAVVPRPSVLAVGGYNEDYATAALEDADLFIRARRCGIRVSYDAKLVGVHNDWAGTTIRDFCQRQRTYCSTAPLLEERFGSEHHPWSELIATNRWPQWNSDGTRVIVRKRLKSVLSHRVPMAALFSSADVLERMGRWRPLLWSIYRTAIAASMFGGYQEGTLNHPPEEHRSAGWGAGDQ